MRSMVEGARESNKTHEASEGILRGAEWPAARAPSGSPGSSPGSPPPPRGGGGAVFGAPLEWRFLRGGEGVEAAPFCPSMETKIEARSGMWL